MESGMAKTLSFGVAGVNGFPVHVEVFSTGGIPRMEIIGLPDASVRESKDRVSAAIVSCGKDLGAYRSTVNLAPADMKKEGPSFDLPIAISSLISVKQIIPDPEMNLNNYAMFGELGLDGRIQCSDRCVRHFACSGTVQAKAAPDQGAA